ncbi:hypothetical protein MMZ19_003603, partial [Acinetobacter baumannii]|nr:hypothetical protein [Acinetobacter baumannii]
MKFLSKERRKYLARLKYFREMPIRKKNALIARKKYLKKNTKIKEIEKVIIDLQLPSH